MSLRPNLSAGAAALAVLYLLAYQAFVFFLIFEPGGWRTWTLAAFSFLTFCSSLANVIARAQ